MVQVDREDLKEPFNVRLELLHCYYEGMLPGSSRSVDSVASVVCTGPGIGSLSQASVCYGEPSTITTNINRAGKMVVNRKYLCLRLLIVVIGGGLPK